MADSGVQQYISSAPEAVSFGTVCQVAVEGMLSVSCVLHVMPRNQMVQGVLLTSQHQLRPDARDCIDGLKARGLHITIVSRGAVRWLLVAGNHNDCDSSRATTKKKRNGSQVNLTYQ